MEPGRRERLAETLLRGMRAVSIQSLAVDFFYRQVPMAYSIFVSHAAADVALAQRIFQKAHAADIRAYLFEHDTLPGTAVSNKIRQRIQDADAVVALLTKAGVASPYVHQEIGVALGLEKRVVALVATDVPKEKLAMLTGIEVLPLAQNSEIVLHHLVTALQKAKETKSKWLWGLGGLAVGVILASKSTSDNSDEEE